MSTRAKGTEGRGSDNVRRALASGECESAHSEDNWREVRRCWADLGFLGKIKKSDVGVTTRRKIGILFEKVQSEPGKWP